MKSEAVVALACARAACGVRIWNVRCVIACVGACGASDVRHRAWLRERARLRARAREDARASCVALWHMVYSRYGVCDVCGVCMT